ncbi:MAG: hypothetical protein Q9222_007594, partial [Ikaeria aurantiellina]
MATVVANKPAPPHQKMKRPPPPNVQTHVNGVKSSQSSPSPSLSSKRPSSAFKHPSGSSAAGANGINGTPNAAAAARLNNRRRDSQKPGELQMKPTRPSKSKITENPLDRQKRMAEPYVKSPKYILKKYKNKPPSLILHLHPTHFRFDQQDGSFSYTSPMKIILEHLRSQTVPHDLIEELNVSGVKFYEGNILNIVAFDHVLIIPGCLIVQIHDHRSTPADANASASTTANEKSTLYSVHNYNQYLTPSPYVPYPRTASAHDEKVKVDNPKADANKNGKESVQAGASGQKTHAKGPKIFTTVLLPTQQSVEEEVLAWANTPDPRSNNRKQSQATLANRTPASATLPHPPLPLSAVPSTPVAGPPNKKQKMLIGESDVRQFHSKLTMSTAAPLFLDPVDTLEESYKLIQELTGPFNKQSLPARKTRKRTVAELKADEAQEAFEEGFMHIMDERLGDTATGGKASANDGGTGAAAFEPRFERFKTIEQIKQQHREKEQQLQEQRAITQAQIQAANKAKQEQIEQARIVQEKKNAEQARQDQQVRNYQAAQAAQQHQRSSLAALQQQQRQQQQEMAAAAAQNMHGHGPTTNGVTPNQQQHATSISQPPHSSPISRHMTPHSNPRSSPLVGNIPHSVPMNVTSSGQGMTSSPARPSSAAQHGHLAGGVAMVANRSQQRPPSRMGTPSMSNGTPRIQQGTPVIKQGTPTPRMNHGSPQNGMSHTPMINANGLAVQHFHGQPITPEQQAQVERFRAHQMQEVRRNHMQQQNIASGLPPNHGMSPMHNMSPQGHNNLQQFAAQNQGLVTYQAQQQEHHRRMNGAGGAAPHNQIMAAAASGIPNPHARPMPPQPPHHPAATPQQQQQQHLLHQQQQAQQRAAQMQMDSYRAHLGNFVKQLAQQYNGQANIPQQAFDDAKKRAMTVTKQMME